MSRKCIIEKYIYQSAQAVNDVHVKKEDFFMIADLALKQLAISKTETTKPTTLTDKVKKMAHCAIDAGIIDAVDWSAEIIRRLEEKA